MFRIYRCTSCKYIGYAQVESEADTSFCSLCMAMIEDSPEMQYVATANEATEAVLELAIEADLRNPKSKRLMGLGFKKRIFNIVEGLIDMNRGRPVTLKEVLKECALADISVANTEHFLEVLQVEGRIRISSGEITLGGTIYDYE